MGPGFSDEQRAAILTAANNWHLAVETDAHANLTFDGGATIHINKATLDELKVYGGTATEEVYGHTTTPEPPAYESTVRLAEDMPAQYFEWTAEHEIGHALGLHHTGPGTRMCWNVLCQSNDITPADVKQLYEDR